MNFIERLANSPTQILQPNCISTYINPYQYVKLRKQSMLESKIDLFYFDGQIIPCYIRLLGFPKYKVFPSDMSGFLDQLFNDCIKFNKSVYFIGSTQENILEAVRLIKDKYNKMSIRGFRNGYIQDVDYEEVLQKILRLNPDYVLVGMGALAQEKFLVDLKRKGFRGCGIACGGFYHQTAKGKIHYYPKVFKKLNLRWVYRIIDEPKLLYRYLVIYPMGLFLITKDLIISRYKKIK